MTTQTVWFETKPRPFAAPQGLPCHRGQVGSLFVSEHHDAACEAPYRIRFEAEVDSLEGLWKIRDEAFGLASDLDLIWSYVAGVPLFPTIRTVSLAPGPHGWTTNSDQAQAALSIGRAHLANQQIVSRYLVTLPYLPLNASLKAVSSLRAADDVTRFLIELHVASLKDLTGSGAMVFLSKALEVVRAILPGDSDDQRERGLPQEVQAMMRRRLHWLYGIANQRVEVRHVIRDPSRLEFHPRLTHEEKRDYQSDGDIVVRAIICQRLGISFVALNRD